MMTYSEELNINKTTLWHLFCGIWYQLYHWFTSHVVWSWATLLIFCQFCWKFLCFVNYNTKRTQCNGAHRSGKQTMSQRSIMVYINTQQENICRNWSESVQLSDFMQLLCFYLFVLLHLWVNIMTLIAGEEVHCVLTDAATQNHLIKRHVRLCIEITSQYAWRASCKLHQFFYNASSLKYR